MPFIRPNHPTLKLQWNYWSIGFSWAVFSNNGPRYANIFFGPLIFSFCW